MNSTISKIETRAKQRVYLNEYNLVHDKAAYLPLVSGCLHAYALEIPALRDGYEFAPYSFKQDSPKNILAKIEAPNVAAFSFYSWNAKLSLHVAKKIKGRYPNCLLVFGGGSVPHDPVEFMRDNPFIDVCVRGEGERPFGDILMRNLSSWDFSDIPQVSWRKGKEIINNDGEYPFERDMDNMPSPYVGGLFDKIITENTQFSFQAILETNRGCPFKCTFCYWGKGDIGRRFKFHGLERVKQEIDWMGQNKIGYIFSADSNFGMHRRDIHLAQALADSKKRYGYPKRFRACYGKNTDENIFNVGKVLFDHGLDKGVNLSRQSNDKMVLANIKRGNIKMETFRTLQTKFSQSGIPTWTELIIGLPGETHDSFIAGVEDILNSELKSLFLYWLEAFPNTDMGEPSYQKKFGLQLRNSDIKPIHCAIIDDETIMESTQIVTATNSMPYDQWRRTWKFAWTIMAHHSLGGSSHILHFLRR
jgi:putative methyltransferase